MHLGAAVPLLCTFIHASTTNHAKIETTDYHRKTQIKASRCFRRDLGFFQRQTRNKCTLCLVCTILHRVLCNGNVINRSDLVACVYVFRRIQTPWRRAFGRGRVAMAHLFRFRSKSSACHNSSILSSAAVAMVL